MRLRDLIRKAISDETALAVDEGELEEAHKAMCNKVVDKIRSVTNMEETTINIELNNV